MPQQTSTTTYRDTITGETLTVNTSEENTADALAPWYADAPDDARPQILEALAALGGRRSSFTYSEALVFLAVEVVDD